MCHRTSGRSRRRFRRPPWTQDPHHHTGGVDIGRADQRAVALRKLGELAQIRDDGLYYGEPRVAADVELVDARRCATGHVEVADVSQRPGGIQLRQVLAGKTAVDLMFLMHDRAWVGRIHKP